MAVRIITDSTCEFSQKQRAELGVIVAPLTVSFGKEQYRDGIDLTNQEFYQKLRNSDAIPTTSQVSVGAFVELFEQALTDGDEVVGVFLSSGSSGTFQSAKVAAEQIGSDKIYLVDSLMISLGVAALVLEAVKARDTGKNAAEIADYLNQIKQKIRLLFTAEHLRYLQKGGRLSSTSMIVGTLLQVKAVIAMSQGVISVGAKIRGSYKAWEWICEECKRLGIDFEKSFVFGNTDCRARLGDFITMFTGKNDLPGYTIVDVGSTVGTHVGHDCVGVAFFAK